MRTDNDADEPDWDTPLAFSLTPEAVFQNIFASADSVHTGWGSCVERSLIVSELTAVDENSDNHCRLVEQEYSEETEPDVTWHDWTVELKAGDVYLIGHWRTTTNAAPADWDWCAAEAENAFANACLLVGRRVRRSLVLDEAAGPRRVSRTRH